MSWRTSEIRQAIRYATLCRPVAHSKVNDLDGYFVSKSVFCQHFMNQSVWMSKNNTTSAILPYTVHWTTKRECVIINRSAIASLGIGLCAQLTRCFSAVAELLVCIGFATAFCFVMFLVFCWRLSVQWTMRRSLSIDNKYSLSHLITLLSNFVFYLVTISIRDYLTSFNGMWHRFKLFLQI